MQTLKRQLGLTALLLKDAYRLQFDPIMSSRMSLKTFVVDFSGIVFHEGLTNPKLTCETTAERHLGKGNDRALQGKVAVITGSAGKLGFELSRILMKYGCHVVFAPLPIEIDGLKADLKAEGSLSGQHSIIPIDLSDLTTIRPFVEDFRRLNLPLHYLVNNAGIMAPNEFRPSKQGYEAQFAINHLGHFLLTELLMPKLQETSKKGEDVRIVTLSSVGSALVKKCDMDKFIPPSKEMYHGIAEYGISKAMNLFHSRELQKRCSPHGITCCAIHPGVIHTGLLREENPETALLYDYFVYKPFQKSIQEGSATQMHCIASPEVPKQVREGHCFFYNCAPQRARGVAAPGVRDDLCAKVWKISEDLVAPFR